MAKERKYFVLERSDGKCFVVEPTDAGFIHWDHYKPTRIKDPSFEFKAGKPYRVKPAKGGPSVNYTMRDAYMREVEVNVPTGDRGSSDPDVIADFRDARDMVPPSQTTKLITPEDEANYGNELIDLAMRAAKEAMAPELNAVRQETMSQLAGMGTNDTCSMTSPQPTAKLITLEDEEGYGTELIDFAKRAANDAVAPELNALRYKLCLQLAAMRASNGDLTASPQSPAPTKLLTPEDVENYGEELIDFAKRAAESAMDPELNALRQEFLSRLALTAMSDLSTKISEKDRDAIDAYYGFDSGGLWGGRLKNDQDRIKWMDYKDRLKKEGSIERFPEQVFWLGFGAAVVLFTPAGWVFALGGGAVWGGRELYRKWRMTRTLNAYGRVFIFDSQGVVLEATRHCDPLMQ